MHFIAEPYCSVTGIPFQHEFGDDMVSAEAIANPPPYRTARAVVIHDGVARRIVQRLKYADHTELAPWMAQWMVRSGGSILSENDVLVPVPLHRRRYLFRRYNQSAELGRAISKMTKVAFAPEALERVKHTRRQVGLSASERKTNVRGAFKVPSQMEIAVRGRGVLLVDDVFTTGATIEAATKALLRSGAKHVDVLTFSRVVPQYTNAGSI